MDIFRIEMLDDDMAEVLKTKSPAERLKIANFLFNSAKLLIKASLKAQFPDWDEKRLTDEMLARISNGSH